jgi:dipeptidyl aminopeptidase/acylaminoacyl peptidase
MRRRPLAASAVLVLLVAVPLLVPLLAAAAAPAKEPLGAERMWRLARLGPPAISPDGRSAVLAVTTYDVEKDKPESALWIVPTAGGDARQLTQRGSDASPAFSPDGRWIAFVSKRSDDEERQIYVLPVDGGEARRLTSAPSGAFAPRWLPDSRRVAFVSWVHPGWKGWEDQAKRHKAAKESKVSARVFDRLPTRRWDRTLDGREPHLFVAALAGGAAAPVTAQSGMALAMGMTGDPEPGAYDVSPDGREIVFTGQADRTGTDPNTDLYAVPVDGGTARNLTPDHVAADGAPRFSPDGKLIAYTRAEEPRHYSDRARLALLERATGRSRVLTERWDRSASAPQWARDGKSVLVEADHLGRRAVFRVDAGSGEVVQVTREKSFSALAVAARAGTIVALREAFDEPPTLVALDPARGAARKLGAWNDEALASTALGAYESVTYPGAGGAQIQAWVVYPPGFDRAKKHPFVLLLHGGPHVAMNDGFQWRWNAQVFASWGYVVAWHSFHGTPGFGQAFTDSIVPDWTTLPYEDTVAAARWFAAQPWIDPERMAAAGASFGGYLGAAVLGRDHPFKTIVLHAGVYDQATQYGSDVGGTKRQKVPEFWEDEALARKVSPLWRAASFKTPTLVTAGGQDLRVPEANAFALFNALQNRGVKSRLVYYPNENHWVLKPQNSLHWYGAVRDWLAEQLGPAAGATADAR